MPPYIRTALIEQTVFGVAAISSYWFAKLVPLLWLFSAGIILVVTAPFFFMWFVDSMISVYLVVRNRFRGINPIVGFYILISPLLTIPGWIFVWDVFF
ncbi:MAG: hypothetical protein AAB582_00580 [Patescibacteria group bacterium]